MVRIRLNTWYQACFPQRYAAASLKPKQAAAVIESIQTFSAALCCGLIEASYSSVCAAAPVTFSAALCCGLIEARKGTAILEFLDSFSAALCCGLIEASVPPPTPYAGAGFSAALCCGLIEARSARASRPSSHCFPQRYAAASLKRVPVAVS